MPMQRPASDPFALMMDAQSVIHAMEHSEHLARLHRRVCKPLDKPLVPHKTSEVDEFDSAIDSQIERDES
jgi:hypothetical protein